MQVKMEMAIQMVEWHPAGREFLELSVHFPGQGLAQRSLEEIIPPGEKGAILEIAGGVAERVGRTITGRAVTADQRQMESYAEGRMGPGQLNGFVEARLIDHQAGAGEDSISMSSNDRLIDLCAFPEIIRVDD